MNRRELVNAIAVHTATEPRAVDGVLRGFTDVVLATVAKGDPVVVTGFAKFAKVQTAARMGRNPATGEAIKIQEGPHHPAQGLQGRRPRRRSRSQARQARPGQEGSGEGHPGEELSGQEGSGEDDDEGLSESAAAGRKGSGSRRGAWAGGRRRDGLGTTARASRGCQPAGKAYRSGGRPGVGGQGGEPLLGLPAPPNAAGHASRPTTPGRPSPGHRSRARTARARSSPWPSGPGTAVTSCSWLLRGRSTDLCSRLFALNSPTTAEPAPQPYGRVRAYSRRPLCVERRWYGRAPGCGGNESKSAGSRVSLSSGLVVPR